MDAHTVPAEESRDKMRNNNPAEKVNLSFVGVEGQRKQSREGCGGTWSTCFVPRYRHKTENGRERATFSKKGRKYRTTRTKGRCRHKRQLKVTLKPISFLKNNIRINIFYKKFS